MRRLLTALTATVALLISGCASNSTAIPGQGSFVFVSPGGKSEFTYPAGERGTIADFTGTSVTDARQTIKLSDYAGRIMVLNVWGSWCGPCRGEAPDLNVAAELAVDQPVQYLGINVQDDRESAADYIDQFEVEFPSIFDNTSRTLLSMRGLPTSSIPTTIILDRDHRVAHIYLRVVSAQELDQAVDALVAEAGPAAAGVASDGTDAATPAGPAEATDNTGTAGPTGPTEPTEPTS